jgi:hypothetical protein
MAENSKKSEASATTREQLLDLLSEKPDDLLRFDLENENETIRNYRYRVRQPEALGEFRSRKTSATFWYRNRTIKSLWPWL